MRPATEIYATADYASAGLAQYHTQRPVVSGPSPYCDPELGRFFTGLRSYLNITAQDAAFRLSSWPQVIGALEMGRLDYLPDWPETSRIIMLYCGMAGIDGRPVLERIAMQLSQPHPVASPAGAYDGEWPHEDVPAPVSRLAGQLLRQSEEPEPHAAIKAELAQYGAALRSWGSELARRIRASARQARHARHPVRWVLGAASALMVAAMASYSDASRAGLTGPFSGLLRSLQDPFVAASGPMNEGLQWIEVDDPRTRRGDKLPVCGS